MKRSLGWTMVALMVILQACEIKAAGKVNLWDLASNREISLEAAASKLAGADLLLVGETHDRPSHHRAQLLVIETLQATGKPLAVGLEMFQQRNQDALDRWVAGSMDEKEFQAQFRANWGEDWLLYRDIFLYCRAHHIPMVGLNVPPEISSQVAREGFNSLTQEQVGKLPVVTCQVDPEYMKLLRSVHAHGDRSEEAFTHFCEAQLVWDTAMAVYSLDYLKHHPGHTLVVLSGSVHAWKKGIPAQVRKERPETKQLTLLPDTPDGFDRDNTSVDDADYLLLGL